MSEPSPGHLIDTSWAIPPEHAITRRYVLPPGAADEFIAELEDETEEPTPALRALLGGQRSFARSSSLEPFAR